MSLRRLRQQLVNASIQAWGDPARWTQTHEEAGDEAARYIEHSLLTGDVPHGDFDPVEAWIATMWSRGWLENNLPVYRIEVADLMKASDASVGQLEAGKWRTPYLSYLVEPLINGEPPPGPEGSFTSYGVMHAHYPDEGPGCAVVAFLQKPGGTGINHQLMIVMGYDEAEGLDADHFDPQDPTQEKSVMTGEQFATMLGITLPFMLNHGFAKKRAIGRAMARGRSRKKKLRTPMVWHLDVPTTLVLPDNGNGGRTGAKRGTRKPGKRAQHVRRGHWREQPCGPGWRDRKLTWISPHWVNVEEEERVSHSRHLRKKRRR
jgi:hypothetical protein